MPNIIFRIVFLFFAFFADVAKSQEIHAPSKLDKFFNAPLLDINLSHLQVEMVGSQVKLAPAEIDPAELYGILINSVVRVFVGSKSDMTEKGQGKVLASGSAVAISSQLLLTNCHILGREDQIMEKNIYVRQPDGKPFTVAFYSGDFGTDRCVLKSNIPFLQAIKKIRLSESLRIGEKVYAVGSPKGFDGAFSEGMLSAIKISSSARRVLLTTAATAKGSSGGALFDRWGHLVGVTTAVVTDAPHLSIVIPAQDFFSAPALTRK